MLWNCLPTTVLGNFIVAHLGHWRNCPNPCRPPWDDTCPLIGAMVAVPGGAIGTLRNS